MPGIILLGMLMLAEPSRAETQAEGPSADADPDPKQECSICRWYRFPEVRFGVAGGGDSNPLLLGRDEELPEGVASRSDFFRSADLEIDLRLRRPRKPQRDVKHRELRTTFTWAPWIVSPRRVSQSAIVADVFRASIETDRQEKHGDRLNNKGYGFQLEHERIDIDEDVFSRSTSGTFSAVFGEQDGSEEPWEIWQVYLSVVDLEDLEDLPDRPELDRDGYRWSTGFTYNRYPDIEKEEKYPWYGIFERLYGEQLLKKIWAGIELERESPEDGLEFDSVSAGVLAGLRWPIHSSYAKIEDLSNTKPAQASKLERRLMLEIDGRLERRDYRHPSLYGPERADNRGRIEIGFVYYPLGDPARVATIEGTPRADDRSMTREELERALDRAERRRVVWNLRAGFEYTRQKSEIPLYNYERSAFGLRFEFAWSRPPKGLEDANELASANSNVSSSASDTGPTRPKIKKNLPSG